MKNNLIYFSICIVLLHSFPVTSSACQCQRATYKFTTRLSKAPFVGFVEIIGHDTIQDHNFDRTFTIVKVLQQFQGKSVSITIPILDGWENIECLRSFDYFPIGKRFIIKGHFENRKDHEYDWKDTPLPNIKIQGPQILALSICSDNVIEVEEDKAIGNITKPQIVSKHRKDKFFSTITFGLIKSERLRSGNYTDIPQELDLDWVLKFIKNRTRPS